MVAEASANGKTTRISLKSMQVMGEQEVFEFPPEQQDIEEHVELFKSTVIHFLTKMRHVQTPRRCRTAAKGKKQIFVYLRKVRLNFTMLVGGSGEVRRLVQMETMANQKEVNQLHLENARYPPSLFGLGINYLGVKNFVEAARRFCKKETRDGHLKSGDERDSFNNR